MKKQKTLLRDTKTNPNHSYYQYIHPCNLHKPSYDYRFMGIVRDGEVIVSKPYNNLKDCHKAVLELIEEGIRE